jgi:hypothetical protein
MAPSFFMGKFVKYTITGFFCLFLGQVILCAQRPYPEHFGDLLNSRKAWLGRNYFKGDLGYAFQRVALNNPQNPDEVFVRHAIRYNLNINFWKYLYFRNTFYFDLSPSDVSPSWIANYFYQLGWYNWNNKTFSFGYENYLPNNWSTLGQDFTTNLRRGFFFISYNFTLEAHQDSTKRQWRGMFHDATSRIAFTPFARIHIEYQDLNNNFGGYFKPIFGLNLRYTIWRNIFVEGAVYAYPIQATILPWDPDYTYGFGVFNWRSFKLNASYGNWIANRFPWNPKELNHYNFLNGEFLVQFNYSW